MNWPKEILAETGRALDRLNWGAVATLGAVVLLFVWSYRLTDEGEPPPPDPTPKQLCRDHGGAIALTGVGRTLTALCRDGHSGEVRVP